MQKSSQLFLSLLTLSGVLLSACNGAADTEPTRVDVQVDLQDGSSVIEKDEDEEDRPADSEAPQAYEDGTYDVQGSYQSPAGAETVDVSLTLENDIVTAVTVTPTSENQTSYKFQENFAGGISAEIMGKSLDELNVGVVSGSSLTPKGFMDALEQIKADAAV